MNYLSKAAIFLVLCSVTVFFLSREEQRGSFANANRTYIDWLIGNSKKQIREPSVTFLRIDEETYKIFETDGRLGPVDFALLFDRLREYSPKVTAVLPVLAFPDADELLLNTLKNGALRFETLLGGCVLENNPTGVPVSEGVLSLLGSIENVKGDIDRLPEFTGAKNLPELQLRITAKIAFTEIDLADDVAGTEGGSLAVPLLARCGDAVVPSFLLQSVMLENDLRPEDVDVDLGREIRIGPDIAIPIDRRGFLTVFTGLRDRLPVHGADILLWDSSADADGDTLGTGLTTEERAALEKRVVLIGYDDSQARQIPLKGDEKISRAELFALAVATIQSGRYIRKVSSAAGYAVWAGIFIVGLLLLRARRRHALFGAFSALVAFFVCGMILFQINQTWMPPTVPLGLIACTFLGGLALCPGRLPQPADTEAAKS